MPLDTKSLARTGFACPSCECIYDQEVDALDCCSYDFVSTKTRYECDRCGKVHEYEQEAIDCCINDWPVEEWIECTNCSQRWRFDNGRMSREEAVAKAQNCCAYANDKQGYTCDDCGKWYETSNEAVGCCHPVNRSIIYVCTCGYRHSTKNDAAKCCA